MAASRRFAVIILLWILSLQCFSQINVGVIASSHHTVVSGGAGTYTLSSPARTSAGVYKTDGTLVRTLWSDNSQLAGVYTPKWDGTDDYFNVLPVDNYNIKVLSNNVNVNWEGIVGNTSTSLERQQIYSSLDAPNKIEVIGTRAYYLVGYNEGQASVAAFDLNNIQVRQDVFAGAGGIVTTEDMATDGTNFYLASQSAYHTQYSFVYARKISDGTTLNFSSGYTYSESGPSFSANVADYRTTGWTPTGIALKDTFIYVSYRAHDTISVISKNTGALLKQLTVTKPGSLASDGTNLWVTGDSTTIKKYPVNADGTLGATTVTITGLSNVVNIKVGGTLLGVIDAGTSQQVKAFNTSNGTAAWTLGQLGGSAVSPVVTDDRFGFWMIYGGGEKRVRGGIAFQSDGSFWVIDPSNGRMMHFSSSRVLIETIRYMQHVRTSMVVGNDNIHVLGNGLEFEVDYTKTLTTAGGWKAKYNWEGNLTNFVTEEWIKWVNKLSNGRTYGVVNKLSGNPSGGGSGLQIVELDSVNGLRYTPTWVSSNMFSGVRMYPSGDIYSLDNNGIVIRFQKQTLQSFDGSNNPIYSAPSNSTDTLAIVAGDVRLSGPYPAPHEISSSGLRILYSGDRVVGESYVPHLAAMDSTGKILFRTMYSTYSGYKGVFPTNAFDIGNGIGMGTLGSSAQTIGRIIETGYPAEGYKAGQANKYNLYYDNGLYIGQFGVEGGQFVDSPTVYPGMAGNAYYPAFTKSGSNYYSYNGDESVKGGVHRWTISNTASIAEQVIPITSAFTRSTEVSPLNAGTINLMATLPYRADLLVTPATNWTATPVGADQFSVQTNIKIYDRRKDPDLTMIYGGPAAKSVAVSLGTNSALSTWGLAGNISYNGTNPNYWDSTQQMAFLEVLDNTGKVIVRIQQISSTGHDSTYFKINNTTMFTRSTYGMQITVTNPFRPMSITKSGSGVTLNYYGYSATVTTPWTAGADISSPTTMRMYYNSGAGSSDAKQISLDQWKFSNTSAVP
jgi:hypothetical protein